MVRMCCALVLALVAQASAFRVVTQAASCACSDTGVVDGVDTHKAGCAEHSGQRFGYICYVDEGAECVGARMSHRLGVYWRSCRSEHLADTAKEFLLKAMDGIDLNSLERTIRIAERQHVDQPTLDAAATRVDDVHEMLAVQEELLAAMRGSDADRLQGALQEIERLEMDEFLSDDTLTTASNRLEYLVYGPDAEAELRAAMIGTDVVGLRASIQNVARFHNSLALLAQANKRVEELLYQIAEAEDALAVLVLGTDTDMLEEAIVSAERLDLNPTAMASANNRLDALFASKSADADLLQAIQGENKDLLADALATARDAGIDIDASLRAGQERAAALQVMADEAADNLTQMFQGTDADGLRHAIAAANRLHAVDSQVIRDSEGRLRKLIEIDRATEDLQAAFNTDSMGHLQQMLQKARDAGVSPSDLAAGEEAANRLRSRMHNAKVNLVRLTNYGINGNELHDAIDLARRLHAASPGTINQAMDKLSQLTR